MSLRLWTWMKWARKYSDTSSNSFGLSPYDEMLPSRAAVSSSSSELPHTRAGRMGCEESRSEWEAPRNDDVHGPCDDSRDGEEAMVREGMTSQERRAVRRAEQGWGRERAMSKRPSESEGAEWGRIGRSRGTKDEHKGRRGESCKVWVVSTPGIPEDGKRKGGLTICGL